MTLRTLKKIPSIKSVMTTFPYSIDIHEPLKKAKEMMCIHQLKFLPVSEDNQATGVITEEDISRMLDPNSMFFTNSNPKVSDAYTTNILIVSLSEPLDKVVLNMVKKRVKVTLIIRDNRMAGIFTYYDACQFLGDLLQAEYPRAGDDQVA